MMKTHKKEGQNDICVYNRKFAYSYTKLKRTKPAETRKVSKTILERSVHSEYFKTQEQVNE